MAKKKTFNCGLNRLIRPNPNSARNIAKITGPANSTIELSKWSASARQAVGKRLLIAGNGVKTGQSVKLSYITFKKAWKPPPTKKTTSNTLVNSKPSGDVVVSDIGLNISAMELPRWLSMKKPKPSAIQKGSPVANPI